MEMENKNVLLIERRDLDLNESEIVTDEDNKKKTYKIRGIFMQSELKNRNGRIYPANVMDPEVNRHINEYLNRHRSGGELNHPVGPGSLSINYERMTHKITSLEKQGNNWIGEAIIANNTPLGGTIAGLMDIGIQMGVSSRATGSLKLGTNGAKIVQNDFKLITPADIVSDPSAPDAYVTSLMEGKEWVIENGHLSEEVFDEMKNTVNNTFKNKVNEAKLISLFHDLLRKI